MAISLKGLYLLNHRLGKLESLSLFMKKHLQMNRTKSCLAESLINDLDDIIWDVEFLQEALKQKDLNEEVLIDLIGQTRSCEVRAERISLECGKNGLLEDYEATKENYM